MIKSQLVMRVAEQNPHLYSRDVEKAVNAIFGEIETALVRRDRVELRGFGVFTVKTWPARLGRNPKTGAKINVPRPIMRRSG
jgi:integration host factor subunit beta